jgi:hypothetical protein
MLVPEQWQTRLARKSHPSLFMSLQGVQGRLLWRGCKVDWGVKRLGVQDLKVLHDLHIYIYANIYKYIYIYRGTVLLEFRALYLLGRCSTTWTTPTALFALVSFFCGIGIWTQDVYLESLHRLILLMGFFEIGSLWTDFELWSSWSLPAGL